MKNLLSIIKGFASLFYSGCECTVFLCSGWSTEEMILLISAGSLFIILKLSMFLFCNFNIDIPFKILKNYNKIVLISVFWISVLISLLNVLNKIYNEGFSRHLFLMLPIYLFLIILDYAETNEVIKKLSEKV